MFFSATISAGFVFDHPMQAIRIGLTEIPANCLFLNVIKQTIKKPTIRWDRTTNRFMEMVILQGRFLIKQWVKTGSLFGTIIGTKNFRMLITLKVVIYFLYC